MATYDDYNGVYFTVQALRLLHPEVMDQTSFLILDNCPSSPASPSLINLVECVPGGRYLPFSGYTSTAVRDLIFRESTADIVLCIDAHVLIRQGGLRALLDYFDADPESRDIVQGPLLSDNLHEVNGTHFAPRWGAGMFGQWSNDDRFTGFDGEPFEIPSQGLGLFASRREAWPGINPRFRTFGGEEGYLQEKFRQRGGRAVCLPALGWAHRFHRPDGPTYPATWIDRLRNYHVGWGEIGWSIADVDGHFRELLDQPGEFHDAITTVRRQLDNPLIYFDGIFALSTGEDQALRAAADDALALADLDWRVEWLPAPAGADPDRRTVLAFRAAVETAQRRAYASVLLVLDRDANLVRSLDRAAAAVAARTSSHWDLVIPDGHAGGTTGVNRAAFGQLLADLPAADDAQMDAFLARYGSVDAYLASTINDGSLASLPVPNPDQSDSDQEADSDASASTESGDGSPQETIVTMRGFGFELAVADATGLGIAERLAAAMPSEMMGTDTDPVHLAYRLILSASGRPSVMSGAEVLHEAADADAALAWLRAEIDSQFAFRVKEVVVVHAGVVGWRGRAILIPGRSGTGKSSLVNALVAAGADYYSDEYALIDSEGLVHPYARNLSIGPGEGVPGNAAQPENEGPSEPTPARPPLEPGLIVSTSFQVGAHWQPRELSGGRAALHLLDNVVTTREQPQRAVATASDAAAASLTLIGPRGDADETAARILSRLDDLIDGVEPPLDAPGDHGPGSVSAPADSGWRSPRKPSNGDRRAVVCFVEDQGPLFDQAMSLRESLLHVNCPDTDLVVFGPPEVLARLPDDVVGLEQRVVADDPEWFGYRYANDIASLNGANGRYLDRYTHLLRTDVDTFLTPAWRDFRPDGFMTGHGAYSNDDNVRGRLRAISAELGLTHHGLTGFGSTWYGPTAQIRNLGALTEMLTRLIWARHFQDDPGEWPGWYGGVSLLYAGEVAINHLIPNAVKSWQLDAGSTGEIPLGECVHIHCWHTDEKFSKFAWLAGEYSDDMPRDIGLVPDYCLEMSIRARTPTPARRELIGAVA